MAHLSMRRALVVLAVLVGMSIFTPGSGAATIPGAATDEPLAKTAGRETAVVAGGCFWGIQAVFQHVKA